MGRQTSSQSRPRRGTLVGFVMAAAGMVLILLGVSFGVESFTLVSDAERTTGEVVEIRSERRRDSDGRSTTRLVPQIEYRARGQTYKTELRISPPRMLLPQEGDTMVIMYRADQPEEGRVWTFLECWFLPLLFGGLGTMVATSGVYIIRGSRARHPPSSSLG